MSRLKRRQIGIQLSPEECRALDKLATEHGLKSRNALIQAIAQGHALIFIPQAPQKSLGPGEFLGLCGLGPLNQSLPRALRQWAILRFMPALPPTFSYAEWKAAFFSASHPKGEEIPPIHDPDCPCARHLWFWLEKAGVDEAEWRSPLEAQGIAPRQIEEMLEERLFGVTRRSLAEDFKILAKRGLLRQVGRKYALKNRS